MDESRFQQLADATFRTIEGMLEDGEEIPPPSTLDAILTDRHNRKAIPMLVPVEIPVKAVRVNVMIPDRDLKAIDRYAKRHGMTRSGFLVAAAKQAMG